MEETKWIFAEPPPLFIPLGTKNIILNPTLNLSKEFGMMGMQNFLKQYKIFSKIY